MQQQCHLLMLLYPLVLAKLLTAKLLREVKGCPSKAVANSFYCDKHNKLQKKGAGGGAAGGGGGSGGGKARIISVDSSWLDDMYNYMLDKRSVYEEICNAWRERVISNYGTINHNLQMLYAMSNEGKATVAKDEQQMSPILKHIVVTEDPMKCLEFKHEFTFPSDLDADTAADIKAIVANLKELLKTGDAEVDRWVIDADLFEPRRQRLTDHVHVQVAGTLATVVDPVAGSIGPGEGDMVFNFNPGCTFHIIDQVVRFGNTYVQFDPRLVIKRLAGPHNRPAFKISTRMPNPMPDTLWVIARRSNK